MKRFSVLSLFVLLSVTTQEESRMRALEDQVRALVGEVAALRGELKTLRDAKAPAPGPGNHVLLTSTRIEPGVLPSGATSPAVAPTAPEPNPAPPAPQVAQTQTYGGATSNAKLLNPDISFIGDFVGTAGRNTISPS